MIYVTKFQYRLVLLLSLAGMISCGDATLDSSQIRALPGACRKLPSLSSTNIGQSDILSALYEPHAKGFSDLIVFGDSLSDTGNLRRASNLSLLGPVLLPECVYWDGRFSNGPNWLDYFSSSLTVNVLNYAVGGAATRQAPLSEIGGVKGFFSRLTPSYWQDQISRSWINSLNEQIDEHLSLDLASKASSQNQLGLKRTLNPMESESSSERLVLLWIGANNYLNEAILTQNENGEPIERKASQLVEQTIGDIEDGMIRLHKVGYNRFALATIPRLSGLPKNPDDVDPVSDETYDLLTSMHNKKLHDLSDSLRAAHSDSGLEIMVLGAYEINEKTIIDSEGYGFSDIINPCYKGSLFGPFRAEDVYCKDELEVKLWDWVHPNSRMHCIYANQFLSELSAKGWIESYNQNEGLKRCIELAL